MTNREAIKLLKTILRTVCLGNKKFIDAVKKAISALEKQEWILCSERLPDRSDGYLVSSNDKIVFVLYYSLEHGWDGWWNDRITAWRPLPEPYTEEEA